MTETTDNAAGGYRIEHDTMGEVRVPKNALYAAQTQRAVENFPISGSGLEPAQIVALSRIKRAAAIANAELGAVVMGAKCPVVLTSRADSAESKLCSIVLSGVVASYAGKTGA